MTQQIDRFIEDYAFLSNFHPSTISVDGKLFKTVEHAYQAFKSLDPDVQESVRIVTTPYEAKKLGRKIEIREDWDQVKDEIMLMLVRKKFENPFLAEKLLSTEDAELIEGNRWNDRYWGVCRGEGQNKLGKILMQVRDEIVNDKDSWAKVQ